MNELLIGMIGLFVVTILIAVFSIMILFAISLAMEMWDEIQRKIRMKQ